MAGRIGLMGAASHLGIDLRDYDTRIRSFIPGYEEMLDRAAALRSAERRAWLSHLERRYTPREAAGYLRAWAREDHYQRLVDVGAMLERAGFTLDIVWRRGSFAVLSGLRDGGTGTEMQR